MSGFSKRPHAALVTLTLALACATPAANPPATVMITPSSELSGAACVDFGGTDGAGPNKLCLSSDAAKRHAARVSLGLTDVHCVRAMTKWGGIGFVDPSDKPDRTFIEIEPVAGTVSFLVAGDPPEASASGTKPVQATAGAPGGAGQAGGAPQASVTAPPAFTAFLDDLCSDLIVELYKDPCEKLCAGQPGNVTVTMSRTGGIHAERRSAIPACNVIGPKGFNGASGAGGAGTTAPDAAVGGAPAAAGRANAGQGGAAEAGRAGAAHGAEAGASSTGRSSAAARAPKKIHL